MTAADAFTPRDARVRRLPRLAIAAVAALLTAGASGCDLRADAAPHAAPAASAPRPAAVDREPDAPPGLRVHVQRLFTIALPREFERVQHDDSGSRELRPGENLVRFEDGLGRFLVVAFDAAGAGFSVDATWTLVLLPSGDAFAIAAEEPPCRRPTYATSSDAVWAEDHDCPEGDGRLTLGAKAELHGHGFVFFFGDARRERGVELEPFRAALASFRVR